MNRKRAGKYIAVLMVFSLMVTSGSVLLPRGDVMKDGNVDLADVIVSVRQIVHAAKDGIALNGGMENAITSFSIVAGLQKVLKSKGDIFAPSNELFSYTPVVPAGCHEELLPVMTASVADGDFLYLSPIMTPRTPPPVFA
ncbi:MAG: hypothetical protein JXA41_02385 [Deltaproteobacteria bacterium]|nr:hypothetical protein [Deltaproteobacteria bacterium]